MSSTGVSLKNCQTFKTSCCCCRMWTTTSCTVLSAPGIAIGTILLYGYTWNDNGCLLAAAELPFANGGDFRARDYLCALCPPYGAVVVGCTRPRRLCAPELHTHNSKSSVSVSTRRPPGVDKRPP